jgi:hypothetical protein
MEEVDVKVTLDWCGYPRGGAYWWNHKRRRPRIPPFPGSDELVKAWEAVRGTVDVPAGLSPAEADKLVRTTPGTDLK